MNEKDLRELEYEREMQAQAECMSRWKLRKEIKKKLRALRKKIKADETSLPHLKTISRRLDDVEIPLEPCVMENPDSTPKSNFYEKNLTIKLPCHVEHYEMTFAYDPRMVAAPSIDRIEDVILEGMTEKFGYKLLKAGAIQYRIYNSAIMEHKKQIEMKVDVVIEDTPRENPAKNVDSPTLPIKKCPG